MDIYGLNQDNTCLYTIHNNTYNIYNTTPFIKNITESYEGGIGHFKILYKTNIVAVVGGGIQPKYPPNKVIIWDQKRKTEIGEVSFKCLVKNIQIELNTILIALEHKTYCYSLENLSIIKKIDTYSNPLGICAMSNNTKPIIITLGILPGRIRIERLSRTMIISAHQTDIQCIATSVNFNLVATTSKKGTLIRMFDTKYGKLLQEFRRGIEQVTITYMTFSADTSRLAIHSNKGTIHIFKTNFKFGQKERPSKPTGYIYTFIPKYILSEWSNHKIYLETNPNTISFFSNKNKTITICSKDGDVFMYDITGKVADCIETINIL